MGMSRQQSNRLGLLGMVRVVKERPELTEAKRNEEHKRSHIKDVFTSKSSRSIREN